MRYLMFLMACALTAMCAWAAQVENVAGQLASQLPDHSITSLSVTGTLDARDFKFMRDSLPELATVDLSGVVILAYDNVQAPVFESVQSYAAASIPCTSFMGKKLTAITLPSSLKSIGFGAFAGCRQLKAVSVPETVDSIASYAFNGTGLTAITLPERVRVLGDGVFSRCHALVAASIPNAVIGDFTFLGDTLLSKVTLGSGVMRIGTGAFNGCTSLTSVEFSHESLVSSIGNEAFILSGIKNLDLSQWTRLEQVGDWAFATTPVRQVSLPGSVTKMGEGAFFYDTALASLSLPAHASEVSAFALAGCTRLAIDSILPEGCASVGDYAFYNCSQHADFVIPATVSFIGTQAMAGMTGLQTVKALPATVPALGDSVWAGVSQPLVKLDIPDEQVARAYAAAEQWKEFHILRTVLLGDVDMDGSVDVADVTTLVNEILGNHPASFDGLAADLDDNSVYDSADVTSLINIILHKGAGGYVRKAPSACQGSVPSK